MFGALSAVLELLQDLGIGGLGIVIYVAIATVACLAYVGLYHLGTRLWGRGGSFYRGLSVLSFTAIVPPGLIAVYLLSTIVCLHRF